MTENQKNTDITISQTVIDHAERPQNHGPLDQFNGQAKIKGPCGDTMEFWIQVENERIQNVSFVTDGCWSSLACGSMTTHLAKGKVLQEALLLGQKEVLLALGGLPEEVQHCALLASNTLKAAIENYKIRQASSAANSQQTKKTCETCGDKSCSASQKNQNESDAEFADRQRLQSRLCQIKHKVVVLSGKGGVGKSTVAVNLATALMMAGKKVGLLDVDIHGPSVPTMLGIENERVDGCEEGLFPVSVGSMKVMSIGFLLGHQNEAVIWRGPRKTGIIKQFLSDVLWGDLDYLIIDSPPGTGDEPLAVCQLVGNLDGAIIVTTPQKVASVDVRKSITFCKQLNLPVLGVVENMSGFVCPHCGTTTQILPTGGGREIATDMQVPFLGSIPLDPQIAQACDGGQAFIQKFVGTPTAEIMQRIVQPVLMLSDTRVSVAKAV